MLGNIADAAFIEALFAQWINAVMNNAHWYADMHDDEFMQKLRAEFVRKGRRLMAA